MKKTVKTVFFALLSSAIIAVAVWGSGIIFAMFRPGQVEIPLTVKLEPPEQIPAGNDILMDFQATVPENRSIISAELENAPDTVIVMPLEGKREKWQWNKSIWHFSALFRALKPGEIPEGKVKIIISPQKKGGENEVFNVAVPAFSSVIPNSEKPGNELELSGAMPESHQSYPAFKKHLSKYKYIYAAAIILLFAIIVFVIRKLKKMNTVPELSCWEAALAALEALHIEIRHGDILPAAGYNTLMDILRNYLELRFDLPASRQTTAEFIPELTRSDSPLPEKYRMLLSSFLSNVDLIRFAKAPADLEKLDEAVRQLCGFVSATVPEDGTDDFKGVSR